MTFRVPPPLALLALVACSSESTGSSGPAADTGGAADTEVAATDASEAGLDAAEAPPAAPKPPTLDQLMKMAGALHVMWTNNQSCDFVVGERKTGSTDYVQIFSVKGTIDNKMDSAASADDEYTYRLRCKVGDNFSVYSNELTRNPTK